MSRFTKSLCLAPGARVEIIRDSSDSPHPTPFNELMFANVK